MTIPVLENVARSARHTSFYLSCGAANATPIVFVHGWPELSISWRHQLPVFGGLGLRAIAPDMRGYGRSSVHARHEDYSQEQIVADMVELLDSLGAEKAIWVGHDWGAPVVWSIAQQHPERCHGTAALCVPYLPDGFTLDAVTPLIDRDIYPEDQFPLGQWEYQKFYHDDFDTARSGFDGDVRSAVRLLFRTGDASGRGQPAATAFTRRNGGWFGPGGKTAPQVPRDAAVLTQEDEHAYVASLERNGFFGPDSWYMNSAANAAYAARAKASRLTMPVLFVHAAHDYVCETLDSRLAEPMRAHCADLTEATVASGHWIAQEKPIEVNAALAKWLATQLPSLWPGV